MTLDECVYVLADLLEEMIDSTKALLALKKILSSEAFTIEQVVDQFSIDYACNPEVYVKNIQEDATYLLDDGFDSL